MVDFLHYLMNASFCTGAFYLFYYCLLRKGKLFRAKRIYLLGSIMVSMVIPILEFNFSFASDMVTQPAITTMTADSIIMDDFSYDGMNNQFSIIHLFELVYIIGLVFMVIRLTMHIQRIFHLIRISQTNKVGNIHFVFLNKNCMPFSFFNFIFIDKLTIGETASSNSIIEHEKVHVRELHSLDLIIAELISGLLWFNPFMFFFRKSIKENHEYIADSEVIKSGIHPVDYLTALAKEVFNNQLIGLTSNFHSSTTKKRIIMITKLDTLKKAGSRFLLVLPLLAIMLLAFAKPNGVESNATDTFTGKKDFNSTILSFLPFNIFSKEDETTSDVPSISPIKENDVICTSKYGWRIHPKYKIKGFHPAIDLKAEEGTPVYATASGIAEGVNENKDSKGQYAPEGMHIVIRHNIHFQTRYTHLSGFAIKQGDYVNLGQIIGYVGRTGLCTGTHLHYEVKKDGKHVDPKDYIPKNQIKESSIGS